MKTRDPAGAAAALSETPDVSKTPDPEARKIGRELTLRRCGRCRGPIYSETLAGGRLGTVLLEWTCMNCGRTCYPDPDGGTRTPPDVAERSGNPPQGKTRRPGRRDRK